MPRPCRSARRRLAVRRIWPHCGSRRWPARRLNIVAFPSAAAARQAAVSGNVAAAALGLSSAIGDLRDGRLVGLGIAAASRADAFPDMPPLRDFGPRPFGGDPSRPGGAGRAVHRSWRGACSRALQAVVEDPGVPATMPTPTASSPNGVDGPPGRRMVENGARRTVPALGDRAVAAGRRGLAVESKKVVQFVGILGNPPSQQWHIFHDT